VLVVWVVIASLAVGLVSADSVGVALSPLPAASAHLASASTPRAGPGAPLVWYAPTMGSIDYPELFAAPGRWSSARERVDVFKFYGGNVVGDEYDIGGDNVLQAFVDVKAFRKLRRWKIAIALEIGAIKPFECSPRPWADFADLAISNVRDNGGRVRYVAMDEPLLGGQDQLGGLSCEFTRKRGAKAVARFTDLVTAAHPKVLVGDIEPYPHYPFAELRKWLAALARAGATPAFFHLDVDMERVRVEGQDVGADLANLRAFCERRGIPFGVIMTSNWTRSGTDRGYFESTMEWIETVNDGIGRPLHVIFQSWQGPAASGRHEVPINLPEDDPDVYSHTRLILEGLDVFADPS
jgi:hypothetical protein